MHHRNGGDGRFVHAPEQVKREAVEAYIAGESARSIGRRYGYAGGTIGIWLDRRGIAKRSLSDARRQYAVNHDYFKKMATEEQAYWAGFLLADGAIIESGDCRFVQLALQRKDEKHVEAFREAIRYDGPTHIYDTVLKPGYARRPGRKTEKRYSQVYLRVASLPMIADLKRLGVVPRKSLVARPWRGPRHLMRHYWRGVFDGDGSIFKNSNGQWRIHLCGSKQTVIGFRDFIACEIGERSPLVVDGRGLAPLWNVRYGAVIPCKAIASLLWNDTSVFLDRKKQIVDRLVAEQPPKTGRPWRACGSLA